MVPNDIATLVERHPMPWRSVCEDPGRPHRFTLRDASGAVIAWVTRNPEISERERRLNDIALMEDLLRRWEDD